MAANIRPTPAGCGAALEAVVANTSLFCLDEKLLKGSFAALLLTRTIRYLENWIGSIIKDLSNFKACPLHF
jgi:hypothetical protein